MDEPNQWQQLLLSFRKAKNLTQDQLSELLGVTITQVNRWENGRGIPGKKSQQRILGMLEGRRPHGSDEKLDQVLGELQEIKSMLREALDKDITKT